MNSAAQRRWLHVVFLLSGAPGLIAQLAWTRVLAAGLGHEMPALVGVVAGYFTGLAAGAWILDGVVARSRVPIRWYAGLEIFSGAWILLSAGWLPDVAEVSRQFAGVDPTWWRAGVVAFVVPLAIAGPAAAAMGATLPAIERAVSPLVPGGRAVGGLYALNTAGAMAGVLGAVWLLMPALGFRNTLALAAAIQIACGLTALALARPTPPFTGDSCERAEASETDVARCGPRLAGIAFGAGLLGIGFEMLGVRALAQVTENTIHTFAAALAALLAGTALGAAMVRGLARRGREPALAGISRRKGRAGRTTTPWAPHEPHTGKVRRAAECAPYLGHTPQDRAGVEKCRLASCLGWLAVATMAGIHVGMRGQTLLNAVTGQTGRELGEALLALAVFLPAAMGMGATFAVIAQAARGREGGVGRVLACNCLGAALAGPAFVGVLLPWLGLKWACVVAGAGYLALVPIVTGWRGRGATRLALPCAIAVGLVLLLPNGMAWLELPVGATLVRYDEGRLATVSVIRTADGHRVLRVNNRFQQGGTATAAAARRHGHLPLLLHPAPRRALFLGVGTGVTMGAAAAYAGLTADGVELLPGVVSALPDFEPENEGPQHRAGSRVHTADARRFVRVVPDRYDVIVADLFHPAEDGAGFLYTREHFAALRDRLNDGGFVCQWLPLHQLDLASFRDVTRTFLDVFPDASLWLLRPNLDAPVVGLVGGRAPLRLDGNALSARMSDGGDLEKALRALGLSDAVRVLGHCLADADSLRRLTSGGEVATDDRPLALFRAPAAAYRPEGPPHRRLIELLGGAEPGFGGWIDGAGKADLLPRLSAFRRARDLHLRGLAGELEGRRKEALDAYLASVEASPDFTAGYAQAVLVAAAYAREDPALARDVLRRLVAARPGERLARELLGRLGE